MAQTGYTPILIYSSSTASQAPAAGNLTNSTLGSELAINITDGKLFYKDNANAIQVIGWKVTPATAGGTGQTSYAVGDILYADTTTSLAKLADVATGNALISGGVGVAPAWGKIGLTTHVSGTLPIANGGTAQTSFTANYIHYGSFSTSANLQFDGTNFGVGGAPNAFAGGYYGLQTKTFAMWSAGGVGGQLSTNLYFNGSNRIYIGNGTATEYQQSNGGHYWSTATSGTAGGTVSLVQQMALDTNGNQTLNIGNWVQGTAAKGINFTANSATAGMTSQLLNWYEEGTWTLGLTTAGGNFSSISINVQTVRFTRIGRSVTVSGSFYTSGTVSGGSGQVYITGLPYSGSDSAIGRVWVNPDTGNYASPSALPTGGIVSGTQFRLFKNGTTNNPAFNSTELATSGNANNIYFTVTYQV